MDAQKGYISLERAKTMIIMALDQFDQELASRAAHILYNHERLNIVEVAETKTNMMMCRPAGITYYDRIHVPVPERVDILVFDCGIEPSRRISVPCVIHK